jgi:hypothetical protein
VRHVGAATLKPELGSPVRLHGASVAAFIVDRVLLLLGQRAAHATDLG